MGGRLRAAPSLAIRMVTPKGARDSASGHESGNHAKPSRSGQALLESTTSHLNPSHARATPGDSGAADLIGVL